MNFDTKVQQMFFNGDVINFGEDLFEGYKNSKELSLDPPAEGYTEYPGLSALGEEGHTESYTFRFKSHPYVSFKFREGVIMMICHISKGKKRYDRPHIKFYFDNKEQSEQASSELSEIFTALSTKKRSARIKDINYADFTNDNSEAKQVMFIEGKFDILAEGFVFPSARGLRNERLRKNNEF